MLLTSKIIVCLICAVPILSCTGKRPSSLGISGAGLAPCPSSRNCVSSDAPDGPHRVESFELSASPDYSSHLCPERPSLRRQRTIFMHSVPALCSASSTISSFIFGSQTTLWRSVRPPVLVTLIWVLIGGG